jgi:hypothetical protein
VGLQTRATSAQVNNFHFKHGFGILNEDNFIQLCVTEEKCSVYSKIIKLLVSVTMKILRYRLEIFLKYFPSIKENKDLSPRFHQHKHILISMKKCLTERKERAGDTTHGRTLAWHTQSPRSHPQHHTPHRYINMYTCTH